METIPVTPQGDSSGANPNSVKSDDSSPQHESGRGSPPPNCAICLGTCRNKSFTDSCLHQFCFKCLLTWSKVKAECPLCKQNFKSIIHNVRSNHQYEEYMVEQRQTEEIAERIDIDSLANATRRFRYRTTMTLPRRESIAIQQLLLQYPLMADTFPPPAPAAPPRRRRSPASFRRTVYRHNLWARPLPDFTGRYRDCSPEFYRYNYAQTQRLVPWLHRELTYLLNENVGHISYVLTRILELLPQYHINSPEFREALQRYFGDRTEHFLHELYCFASTPYDMTGYDRNVQYTTDTRISTMINEVISSSESDASVDSDIVMVTSSEPAEPPPGPSRVPLPVPVYPQNYIPQPPVDSVIPIETISHSDTDDDSSEIMLVGYIKPPQERTPEVVDLLGSDSDVIVTDNAQPETSQANEIQEVRPTQSLVKLSLRRHSPARRPRSESEDSTYTPPRPTRSRKRRHRSEASIMTSDTSRDTSSPETTISNISDFISSTHESSDDTFFSSSSSSSSDSAYRRKRATRKKSRRKVNPKPKVEKDKKKTKKRSRSHHKVKKTHSRTDKEKRSKRKSHSGKGVKSSKKSNETEIAQQPTQSEQMNVELDQPSTSGVSSSTYKSEKSRKRRRISRENKRLKSVVNVMNSERNTNDSSSSGNANLLEILSSAVLNPKSAYNSDSGSIPSEERTRNVASDVLVKAESCFNVGSPLQSVDPASDPEDELPLNLTIKKSEPNSS